MSKPASTLQGSLLVVFLAAALLLSLVTPSATAIVYPNAMYGGCVLSTDNGAMQDSDCDKVPDPFDNCPVTPNPDQLDIDKNGIGDACDLIIEEITIEPEPPMQGRSVLVTAALFNNREYPMRNLIVKTDAPSLGVAQSEDIGIIGPGQRVRVELVLRVPECAPTRATDFAVIAEYPFAPGQKEVFSQVVRVPIAPSGACSAEAQESDKTIVNILDIQDVDPSVGALYPFTIKNTWPESKAYVLSVQMQNDWGTSEIHPGTVIIVPAGEQRDGAVQVWARPGIEGKRNFMLTIQAKDDLKQVMLMATVPQSAPVRPPMSPIWVVLGGLIILGVIIAAIIVFVVLGMHKRK